MTNAIRVNFGKRSIRWAAGRNYLSFYHTNPGAKAIRVSLAQTSSVDYFIDLVVEKGVAPPKQIQYTTKSKKNSFYWDKNGLFRIDNNKVALQKLDPKTNFGKQILRTMVLRNAA